MVDPAISLAGSGHLQSFKERDNFGVEEKLLPKVFEVVVGAQKQLRQVPVVVASQMISKVEDLEPKRKSQLPWPLSGCPPRSEPRGSRLSPSF